MSPHQHLLCLEPPYAAVTWLREAPALGTILLVDGVDRHPLAEELRSVMAVAPWCPIGILTSSRHDTRKSVMSHRVCCVPSFGDATDGGSAMILASVRRRTRPTPQHMADWVAMRAGMHALRPALADLFAAAPGAHSSSAITRARSGEIARRLGGRSVREWQFAVILADAAADASVRDRLFAPRNPLSIPARDTLAGLLGVTEQDFHSRLGWEWVLEAALRGAGVFAPAESATRSILRDRSEVGTIWFPSLAPVSRAGTSAA
jgi:hypothetical protein